MATFPATIVTPERVLLEAEAEAVMLRTAEGDAAFLAGHTPLVGSVVPGVVRVQREDGTEERAAVHGGFITVAGDGVVVVSPIAELVSDIDVDRAQRALETAEAALAELASGARSATPAVGSPAGPGSAGEEDADAVRARAAAQEALHRAQIRLDAARGGAA
jgi:F-type H+-transporting ATPase subunit epsilon